MFKTLFITLLFGLLIGLTSALYLLGLEHIQLYHLTHSIYPYYLLPVFLILLLVKRNILYFPISVHEVVDSKEAEQKFWSPFAYLVNLVGSWLSHAAGASLGREGTMLVLASNLAQLFKLNWAYYRAVVLSAAFACVVGEPWVALIIIIELFSTTTEQKIFSLIMAWVGVLILRSFEIKTLFQAMTVDLSASFTDKLFAVVLIGLTVGLMTRFYKTAYLKISVYLAQRKILSGCMVIGLTALFLIPALKPLHSLSLETFAQIRMGQADISFTITKMLFTLLFVSLGFIGGDFVPSIIIGSAVGVLIANFLKVPYSFGLAMGILAFFTGLSRLKWTSLWILFFIVGFSPLFWAYLCLSVARYFSGPISLYRKLQVEG